MRRDDLEEILLWFFAGLGLQTLIKILSELLAENWGKQNQKEDKFPIDFPED